ncbi:MAG TPA: hypothetical protein VK586_04240 [Streptosporangiaceae bacterium]|nr:hypothetical protein [Streptosporangiaceae bacterium]
MPPPTAIRAGFRPMARLTTWKASSVTNSLTRRSSRGSSELAPKTSSAVRTRLPGGLSRAACRATARPLIMSSSGSRASRARPTSDRARRL